MPSKRARFHLEMYELLLEGADRVVKGPAIITLRLLQIAMICRLGQLFFGAGKSGFEFLMTRRSRRAVKSWIGQHGFACLDGFNIRRILPIDGVFGPLLGRRATSGTENSFEGASFQLYAGPFLLWQPFCGVRQAVIGRGTLWPNHRLAHDLGVVEGWGVLLCRLDLRVWSLVGRIL